MLLLLASAVAIVLGVIVMPWRVWRRSHGFDAGLVVATLAGCTFLGLGISGAILALIMLLIH